jgi:Ethanolamine utilization protein EutJ (predicted chaperonin)
MQLHVASSIADETSGTGEEAISLIVARSYEVSINSQFQAKRNQTNEQTANKKYFKNISQ